MSAPLAGVYPMLVTPFAADGTVAVDEIGPVVAHQLAHGCPGVSALGLAGEASDLTPDERRAVAAEVLARAGPGRAIVGCSADDTALARTLAEHAATRGAAAVMVAAPRHLRTVDEIAGHYATIADAVAPLPVIVQDAPAFLDVTLGPSFVASLMSRCANVRYAKPEGVPAAGYVAELVAVPGLRVLGGHGGLHLPDELAAGAVGTLPGCEAPAQHQAIVERFTAGDREGARVLHARLLPLLVCEFQGLGHYVRCVKELLVEQSLISSAATRMAARALSPAGRELLIDAAVRAGILDRRARFPPGPSIE